MNDKKMGKFDIDIELKDLLWEFVRRWRLIVVFAIICGVGLAVYQYHIDINKTDVVTVKKNQEELEKAMSTQDRDEVSAAVALKRQADERSAYMETSELMRINPYEENAVFLQYYVNAERYAADIREAYVTYISQGSLENELVCIVRDSDTAYYNAKNSSDRAAYTNESGIDEQVFSIKIIGATADAAMELASKVKNSMQDYGKVVAANIAEHQLNLMDECSVVIQDQKLAELQNWNATTIKTICNNLDSMKNEMTGDQISLYTYRTTVTVDTIGTTNTAVTDKTVTVSMKHAVIGAIVGIILACGVIVAAYLFAAALRNGEEVKTLYGVTVLGYVDDSVFGKKKVFGFIDRFFRKLRDGRRKKSGFEQEVQMVCANILLNCEKRGNSEIVLLTSAAECIPEELVQMIIDRCTQRNVMVSFGTDIAYNAEMLEKLVKTGSAVLLEKEGASLYDEMYQEILLCKEHDVDVIGMIVVGV